MCIKDVTTRGNYYPDKAMATAAVSEKARDRYTRHVPNHVVEPAALPTRHQHEQRRTRKSSPEDQRVDATRPT